MYDETEAYYNTTLKIMDILNLNASWKISSRKWPSQGTTFEHIPYFASWCAV